MSSRVPEWAPVGNTQLQGEKWESAGSAPATCQLSARVFRWSKAHSRFTFKKNPCSEILRAAGLRGGNHLEEGGAVPVRDGEFLA